jgi:hypothetical protein
MNIVQILISICGIMMDNPQRFNKIINYDIIFNNKNHEK